MSFVTVAFPINVGLAMDSFGFFGDVGVDIKVLELTIFLKFRICIDLLFFSSCPVSITLWRFSITAYEYQDTIAQWGTGSRADKSQFSPNIESAKTILRVYFAFKDAPYPKYNGEYDYEWEESNFDRLTNYTWVESIFTSSLTQIKYANVTTKWYLLDDAQNDILYITDPYDCKYDFVGFDKLLITDINIQWYSAMGMQTNFANLVQQLFEEKLCCDFALKIYKEIEKATGVKFDISSYKIVTMDVLMNWYPNQCAQFFLNVEEQIDQTPYFDDCADEGWKIAKGLTGDYKLGFHSIYADGYLVHYDGHSSCLNWYNSTSVTKTKRYDHL